MFLFDVLVHEPLNEWQTRLEKGWSDDAVRKVACRMALMAGYSGTPLPQKLGIKPGSRIAFVAAPSNVHETLGTLPANVAIVDAAEADLDVILCFVTEVGAVEQAFLELKPKLAWTGGLWLAWPKKVAGQSVTLVENTIRDIGLAAGLVDNKVCAIDERWSGLRFVWRVQDRPKPAPKKIASHAP